MKRLESRYHLIKELGVGGSGTVYLATDKKDRRQYALKVIPYDYNINDLGDEDGFQDIQISDILSIPDEMNLMKLISSPPQCYSGLVCYYDYGIYEFEGSLVFAVQMEYIPGPDLFDYLMRQPTKTLSEREVVAIAIPLFKTLSYLHRNGISHRDIKMENIIMTINGPVIVDLGFACSFSRRNNVRQCNGRPATPQYAAPEIWTGEIEQDPKLWADADLWALGVCLYCLLRGAEPFSGLTQDELEYNILYTEPRRLRLTNPQLNEMLWELLDKEPSQRPSARECYDTLTGAV